MPLGMEFNPYGFISNPVTTWAMALALRIETEPQRGQAESQGYLNDFSLQGGAEDTPKTPCAGAQPRSPTRTLRGSDLVNL